MVYFLTSKAPTHFLRLAASSLMLMHTTVLITLFNEVALTTPGTSITQQAQAQTGGRTNAQSAEAAVVYIQTDRDRSGSGVIVDSSGLIVTNAHVVAGARQIVVTIQGRRVAAEVVSIGNTECLDLALLRLPNQRNLPTVALAKADSIYKTQPVWALGFPIGSTPTSASIVQGSISNIHSEAGKLVFDAPINPGNSGGPVIDSQSRLLGITTSMAVNSQNINYAISVEQVRMFLEAYQKGTPFSIGRYLIPATPTSGETLNQPLTLNGQTVDGILQKGDSHLCQDSSLADVYAFEAEAGQSVMLEMLSRDAGSYLLLIDPSGHIVAKGGSNGINRKAILLRKLLQGGTYTVITNTERPEQSGRYSLQISRPLLVEQGMLGADTAPCFENGARCQQYTFQGQAGQSVTLLMQSAFDPYLIVKNAQGETVIKGRADRQDTVTFELSSDGWYRLVVGGMQPEARGEFQISILDAQDILRASAMTQRP